MCIHAALPGLPLIALGASAQDLWCLDGVAYRWPGCSGSLCIPSETSLDLWYQRFLISNNMFKLVWLGRPLHQEPIEADMPTPVRARRRDTEKNRRSAGPVNLLGGLALSRGNATAIGIEMELSCMILTCINLINLERATSCHCCKGR